MRRNSVFVGGESLVFLGGAFRFDVLFITHNGGMVQFDMTILCKEI